MPNFKVALQNGEEFDFEVLDGKDGLPGAKGEKGDTGPKGDSGENGKDGKDGKNGKDGTNGRDGLDGKDGERGPEGPAGKDGKDAKFSLPEIKKIAKELSKDSNLAWQTVPHLNSIVAGENIEVDNTDPLNPIISSTGGTGSSLWGGITGTLSNQTDLQNALNAKSDTSHNHAGVYEPANANIQSHIVDTNNPHGVTQTQVGLGNVDNTSDVNKPVSTATQSALDLKATLQETDDILSTGLVSGGALTAGTGSSINIAAGVGWVNHAGTHQRVTWNAFSNQASVAGGTNYVGIDSSGAVSISATRQDNSTIYLGNFYSNAAQSMVIEVFSVPEYAGDFIAKINNWLVDTVGTLIQEGNYVQEQSNPDYLKLSISGGSMHARLGEYTQSSTTSFTKMYNTADYGRVPDTSNLNTVSTSHWNNTTNNMATALVAMTTNYWKKDMIIRLANGNVYYIYGQAEYATEDLAKASALPVIPDEVRNDTALLAIIVSKQGDTTIANRLYDIRPLLERIFGYGTAGSSGAVIDHGSLTGLGDDDHAQYHNDTRGDARYVQKNASITGATKTKITYDSKGLVTTSADATTADIADSTNRRYVTDAQLAVINKDEFGVTVDGSGTVLTTGTKGLRPIGYNCTITGWQLVGNISGSVVFDVKRNGTSLAGTEKPTLSSQQTNSDTTLTTWTTSLSAGDIIEFVIDSASTITRATLTILVTKT